MITENQKAFLKMNRKVLNDIFTDKLTDLTNELFDAPVEKQSKMIDAINVLRDWLREIQVLDKQNENKKDNFI